jgi:hypothetical protein
MSRERPEVIDRCDGVNGELTCAERGRITR